MFHYESNWTNAAIRRFIVRVQKENFENLFDLWIGDVYGMHNKDGRKHNTVTCQNLLELKDRIDEELKNQNALSLKDLAINGNDITSLGGSGKQIWIILNQLLDCVLEDPEINTKEKLLEDWKERLLSLHKPEMACEKRWVEESLWYRYGQK